MRWLVAIVLLLSATPAAAQRFEITPFASAGYSTSGSTA